MIFALQTLTDKIYMGNVVSGVNAADSIRMSEILFGGRESIEQTPAMISLVNCNSPLRWDGRMLEALFEYANANQAMLLTPFLLMGAMSPVSIPATLAQQIAEALAGHRARAADPARLPGDLRLVPLEHRHAVGLAAVRHARVGHRPASAPARSRAASACRSARAAASRRARRRTRSRPTRR